MKTSFLEEVKFLQIKTVLIGVSVFKIISFVD